MLLPSLLLQLAAAAGPTVPGNASPAFDVPRATEEIVVDGRLDEPAWNQAARLTSFSQYEPSDGQPAAQETEVRVFYTPQALHFGIVAQVRPGSNLNATLSKRDAILNDDRVIIYLDTFNDRRRAFVFGVNPLGVQLDGVRSEGSGTAGRMFGGGDDWSPDFHFESRGQVADGHYVVEVRIPFKSLRFSSSGPQEWGLNISRITPSTNTEDTWVATRRASASFLAQAGTMRGIEDVERGIVTEWQPFMTTALNGARDELTGEFDRGSAKLETGVNLRVGFPAVSLDATINPDFSQVETDVGLVTANERFALFIPEKRPFFLEGIELFSTPNQLVYTRRVISPAAGAKITGKLGRLGIAHLTALDDRPGDDALFNVSRIRSDFGGNSVAGLTLTDRRAGGDANSVVAADSRIVFGRIYYFEGQLGHSWTDVRDVRRSAPMWSAVLDRTGQLWGFHYSLTGFGRDFESEAGFVPRNDNVDLRIFNRLAFYGRSEESLIKSLWVFAGPGRIWRYDDFARRAALEGEESARTMINLKGGWQVNGEVARGFFSIDSTYFPGVSVSTIEGALEPYAPRVKLDNLWRQQITVNSPVLRTFNASATYTGGGVAIFAEGSEGRSRRIDVSLGFRPTPGIRVEGLAALAKITRSADGSEFSRTFIPRLKLEYQPARSLFFRVVSEMRDERTAMLQAAPGVPLWINGVQSTATRERSLRTDWLVSYEPSPGTVAFLGYGSTLERPEIGQAGGMRRELDGFFLKLAYQFRN